MKNYKKIGKNIGLEGKGIGLNIPANIGLDTNIDFNPKFSVKGGMKDIDLDSHLPKAKLNIGVPSGQPDIKIATPNIKTGGLNMDLSGKANMPDNEKQFELSEKSIFQEINLEILKQLTKLCEQKTYISILYTSRNLLKNINFVPIFMKYENESVYVWGYNEEHQDYS